MSKTTFAGIENIKAGPGGPTEVSFRFDSRLREVMSHARNNMADQIEESGDDVVLMAAHFVNVDEGELRDSIRYTRIDRGNVQIVADAKDKDGYSYAAAVEFGTVKNKANPFMIPAMRIAMSNFRENVNRKGILGEVG